MFIMIFQKKPKKNKKKTTEQPATRKGLLVYEQIIDNFKEGCTKATIG